MAGLLRHPLLPLLPLLPRHKTFIIAYIVYLAQYLSRAAPGVVYPLLLGERLVTEQQLGNMQAISYLCYATVKLVSGPVLDRRGGAGHVGLLVSGLGGAVGTALFALSLRAHAPIAIVALAFSASRAALALSWGAVVSIIAQWYPRSESGRAVTAMSTAWLVGDALVRVVLGAALSANMGWLGVLLGSAIITSVFAVAGAAVLRGHPDQPPDSVSAGPSKTTTTTTTTTPTTSPASMVTEQQSEGEGEGEGESEQDDVEGATVAERSTVIAGLADSIEMVELGSSSNTSSPSQSPSSLAHTQDETPAPVVSLSAGMNIDRVSIIVQRSRRALKHWFTVIGALLGSKLALLLAAIHTGLTLGRETFREWGPVLVVKMIVSDPSQEANKRVVEQAALVSGAFPIAGGVAAIVLGLLLDLPRFHTKRSGLWLFVLWTSAAIPALLFLGLRILLVNSSPPALPLVALLLAIAGSSINGPYAATSVFAVHLGGRLASSSIASLNDFAGYISEIAFSLVLPSLGGVHPRWGYVHIAIACSTALAVLAASGMALLWKEPRGGASSTATDSVTTTTNNKHKQQRRRGPRLKLSLPSHAPPLTHPSLSSTSTSTSSSSNILQPDDKDTEGQTERLL